MSYKQVEYKAPFDDNKLIYDKFRHMYLLNKDYVINTFGSRSVSSLNDEESWQALQFSLSDNIYTFIYSYKSGELQYDIMEYELSHNQLYREVIAEALISQFEYANTTSGDVAQLHTGITLGSDKVINIETLRGELMVATKAFMKLYTRGLLNSTTRFDSFDYENLYRKDY